MGIQNGWAFNMVVVLTGHTIAVDHAFNLLLEEGYLSCSCLYGRYNDATHFLSCNRAIPFEILRGGRIEEIVGGHDGVEM